MERDEILKLAHQTDCLDHQHYGSQWVEKLELFANKVAAAEREKCAQICEDLFMSDGDWCAKAIRKGCAE